jgi:hypothetical protein
MTNYNQPDTTAKKFADKPEVKAVLSDAKSLTENASKLVSSTREEGAALVKDGKKYVKDIAEKDFKIVKDYIQEHPGKSAAFAVLGGFLLSRFLGRSRK